MGERADFMGDRGAKDNWCWLIHQMQKATTLAELKQVGVDVANDIHEREPWTETDGARDTLKAVYAKEYRRLHGTPQ